MQLTVGTLMFLGGIIGMIVLIIILFCCIKFFLKQRKKLLASIDIGRM